MIDPIIDNLEQQKAKLESTLKEKEAEIAKMMKRLEAAEKMFQFIEKAHHLDGCIRRYKPYPLRNQKEECNCGRLEALTAWKESQ